MQNIVSTWEETIRKKNSSNSGIFMVANVSIKPTQLTPHNSPRKRCIEPYFFYDIFREIKNTAHTHNTKHHQYYNKWLCNIAKKYKIELKALRRNDDKKQNHKKASHPNKPVHVKHCYFQFFLCAAKSNITCVTFVSRGWQIWNSNFVKNCSNNSATAATTTTNNQTQGFNLGTHF